MGSAIGQILPLAIGVIIGPVPIIALILMLFSRAATRNSLALMVGWLVGLSAATIGGANLSSADEAATAVFFVLFASLAIILPVVAYLVAKDKALPVLNEMKTWLGANNTTVMAVLFLVLGTKVLGDGLSLLL